MKRINSFCNKTSNFTKNNPEFLSMKELLHNPLKKIKSKELLDCVYQNRQNNSNLNEKDSILDYEFLKSGSDEKIKTDEIKEAKKNIIDKVELLKSKIEKITQKLSKGIKLSKNEKNINNIIANYSSQSKETANSDKENSTNSKTNNNKNQQYNIENNKQNIFNKIQCPIINLTNIDNKIIPTLKMESQKEKNSDINTYNQMTNEEKQKIIRQLIPIDYSRTFRNKKNKNIKKSPCKNFRKYSYENYNEDNVYKREIALREKKEEKLEKLRKEKEMAELSEIQQKPKINKISKLMTKNKTPIYKRLKEIETQRNINKNKIIENIKKENKKSNLTYNNNFYYDDLKKFNENNFNQWLKSNENWNAKKNNKISNLQKEKYKNECKKNKKELLFKPKISKNSENICRYNLDILSVPVSERLFMDMKNREEDIHCSRIMEEENYNFIPQVNSNYPISDKYYEFMDYNQEELYQENRNKERKKGSKKK